MSKFNPPNALALEGNTAENWTKFKKEFQFYMTATESNSKPEDVARLLTYIGEKARDAYYTFTFVAEEDAMKLQPVTDKFNEHLNPRKNITLLLSKFFSYNQGEGRLIDDYVSELRTRKQHCEFGDFRESFIGGKIVLGVQDKKIQEGC